MLSSSPDRRIRGAVRPSPGATLAAQGVGHPEAEERPRPQRPTQILPRGRDDQGPQLPAFAPQPRRPLPAGQAPPMLDVGHMQQLAQAAIRAATNNGQAIPLGPACPADWLTLSTHFPAADTARVAPFHRGQAHINLDTLRSLFKIFAAEIAFLWGSLHNLTTIYYGFLSLMELFQTMQEFKARRVSGLLCWNDQLTYRLAERGFVLRESFQLWQADVERIFADPSLWTPCNLRAFEGILHRMLTGAARVRQWKMQANRDGAIATDQLRQWNWREDQFQVSQRDFIKVSTAQAEKIEGLEKEVRRLRAWKGRHVQDLESPEETEGSEVLEGVEDLANSEPLNRPKV